MLTCLASLNICRGTKDPANSTEEHRLVHLVDGDDLVVLQARFH